MKIVYEIIDDCEVDSEIFEEYISFLIINYDGKLNEKFHSKDLKFEELNELKNIVERCLILLGKIKELPNDLKNKKNYFEFYKTKINAKEIILSNKFVKKEIDEIIKKYEDSNFLILSDFNDLASLKSLREINIINNEQTKESLLYQQEVFEKRLEKLEEEIIGKEKNYEDWEKFVYIFEQYPPNENDLPITYKNNERPFYHYVKGNYYGGQKSWESFLEKMSNTYDSMAKQNNNSIYNKIIHFINLTRIKVYSKNK